MSIQFVLGEMLPPFDLVEQVPALGGIDGACCRHSEGVARREKHSPLLPPAKKPRIEKRHRRSEKAKIQEVKEKLRYLRLADTSVLQLCVQSAGASRAASHTTRANIAIRPEIILLRVSSLAPASHFLICTISIPKITFD